MFINLLSLVWLCSKSSNSRTNNIMPKINKKYIIAYTDDDGGFYHPECLHGHFSEYFVVTREMDDPDWVMVCDVCERLIWIGGSNN
jgi:hypothetical protein